MSRWTGKGLRCEDLEELPSGKPCPDCVPHKGTERTEDLLKHKATKRTKGDERMKWLSAVLYREQSVCGVKNGAPARFEGMPCSEWLERLPGEPPAI